MSIPLIDDKDVKKGRKSSNNDTPKPKSSIKNYKEIKEDVKNSKFKTGSIKHNLDIYKGLHLNRFFWDYNDALNSCIRDIWNSIEWIEKNINKKNRKDHKFDNINYHQKRLFPNYRKDREFKTELRYKYLDEYNGGWKYSAHWINSAIDVAYSIMDSWKKNYNKGKRKRKCPIAKRLFVRVKQTLMHIDKVCENCEKYYDSDIDINQDILDDEIIEKDILRISVKPRQFIYIDLSNRYFKLNGKIGEPILTPTHIHLPIRQMNNGNDNNKDNKKVKSIGWDLNKFSMDGFSPETGWIKIDLKDLYTKHVTYDNKRRIINKLASTKKVVGKRLREKYSKREKNVCNQIVHNVTNIAKNISHKHGFEDLNKFGMQKIKKGRRGKKWNRWINHINWKQITNIMDYKSDIDLVDPYHTSKDCPRCGCTNKDLNGNIFRCVNKVNEQLKLSCGLVIDRQAGASINIYLRMEGLSQDSLSKHIKCSHIQNALTKVIASSDRIKWFDKYILNEFTQTGAERKETNELVRSLYDMMKPQFYMVGSNLVVLKST